MITRNSKREGKGFEVQWYSDNGDEADAIKCDTIEELAQYLSRCLWGSVKGFKNNPTVWHNGKRWCLNEYTPVENDGKEYGIMKKLNVTERKKMVLAMEYIARQINDEDVFEPWLMTGVADGDLRYGEWDPDVVDDYYIEDDNFRDLMDCFLRRMKYANQSGGLYCNGIVTKEG